MQFHWSDFDSREQNPSSHDNCEALAPFVMALFDGEASEEQARRARAHLVVCQMCAQRWLDWNRSRDLLRAVPVPAPPPTQLWRVLMACRLAAFTRRKPSFSPSRSVSGAPTDLTAQILARTTRATAPTASTSIQKRTKWTFLSLPTLAAPALALWLIALQRDSFFVPTPASVEAPVASDSAPRVVRAIEKTPVVRPVVSKKGRIAPLKTRVTATRAISEPLRPVIMNLAAPRESVRDDEPRAEIFAEKRSSRVIPATFGLRDTIDAPLAPRRDNQREPKTIVVPIKATTPVRAPIRAVTTRVVTTVVVEAPVVKRPARVSIARAARPLQIPSRPATLSDEQDVPNLRAVRFQTTMRAPRFNGTTDSDAQPSRVALPSLPPPTHTVLLADWENDTRVDEMRSAVDDLRAALAPEDEEAKS
jgi:hypothetical protein